MADPKEVQRQFEAIEADRKIGRVTVAPARLARGNLLGGKTSAFIEAVKRQGKPAASPVKPWTDTPAKTAPVKERYSQSGELWEEAERLERARAPRKGAILRSALRK